MNGQDPFKLAIMAIATFCFTFFLLWFFWMGAPLPALTVKPLSPSADIPTFQSAVRCNELRDSTVFEEDPEQRELRDAVQKSYTAFTAAPCERKLKKQYLSDFDDFMDEMMDRRKDSKRTPDDSIEVVEVDGCMLDGSYGFDKPVIDTMLSAVMAGYVLEKDIPSSYRDLYRVARFAQFGETPDFENMTREEQDEWFAHLDEIQEEGAVPEVLSCP